jgi:hypothetical protein
MVFTLIKSGGKNHEASKVCASNQSLTEWPKVGFC